MNNEIFSLKGKNIIITGATAGIGRKCALRCFEFEANVVLIGRDNEKLKELSHAFNKDDKNFYSCDITRFEEIEFIVKDAVNKHGPIDGFIHCAGIEMTLPLSVTKPAHYNKMLSLNLIAGFEFARIISKKNNFNIGASLIFIASIMGMHGSPSLIGYSASKGALISGIKSMAVELSDKKIRVNAISPGHIKDTQMTQQYLNSLTDEARKIFLDSYCLGLGSTSDVANGCIFLLSDASKWITGTNLIIDGGFSAR